MTKKIYITILALFCFINTGLKGQITIEKESVISEGSIIEFNDQRTPGGVAKGIILPYVKELSPESVSGTLYYDADMKKVKLVKNDKSTIDLTSEGTLSTQEDASLKERGKGISISTSTDNNETVGVLSFSTENKALLLPYVENVEEMPQDVEPGTIVYDADTKSVAVFNGVEWFLCGEKDS